MPVQPGCACNLPPGPCGLLDSSGRAWPRATERRSHRAHPASLTDAPENSSLPRRLWIAHYACTTLCILIIVMIQSHGSAFVGYTRTAGSTRSQPEWQPSSGVWRTGLTTPGGSQSINHGTSAASERQRLALLAAPRRDGLGTSASWPSLKRLDTKAEPCVLLNTDCLPWARRWPRCQTLEQHRTQGCKPANVETLSIALAGQFQCDPSHRASQLSRPGWSQLLWPCCRKLLVVDRACSSSSPVTCMQK